MTKTIAKLTGVALAPGVSKNGRLYTAELIAGAVAKARPRIDEGRHPMTMLTYHAAGDNSTHIVGRLTSMTLDPQGRARYEAELSDTPHGRTLASLIDTEQGEPFLRSVSIRGAWSGVRRVEHEGHMVETGDELELDGLDFTKSPGVDAASIETVRVSDTGEAVTRETRDGRTLILESVTDTELITEEVPEPATEKGAAPLKSGKPAAAPTKAKNYADPGYQGDKAPRYALDTKAQAKAAWSYINQAKNAANYTSAQLKRIKGRIKAALKKFGVTVSGDEGWLIEPAHRVTETTEAAALAASYYDDEMPQPRASFSTNISNGIVDMSVSSWRLDPHDLNGVARAAMNALCDALLALDPDTDGDVDLPGDDTGETAPQMSESAPVVDRQETVPDPSPPQDPAATPAAGTESTEEAPGMAEPTTPTPAAEPNTAAASQTPPAATESTPDPTPAAAAPAATPAMFSFEQVQQLLAAVMGQQTPAAAAAPAESAPAPAAAAPVAAAAPAATEATPPAPAVQETQEQLIARLVQEGIKSGLAGAVQEHVARNGAPQRKGLVTETGTAQAGQQPTGPSPDGLPDGWPDKPLHQYTAEERRRYFFPQIEGAVMTAKNGAPPR